MKNEFRSFIYFSIHCYMSGIYFFRIVMYYLNIPGSRRSESSPLDVLGVLDILPSRADSYAPLMYLNLNMISKVFKNYLKLF